MNTSSQVTRSAFVPLFIVSMAFAIGSILLPVKAYAYGSYCGDGVVNQSWEQCDGGSQCTDKCTLVNQCADVVLARVVVTDTEVAQQVVQPADPYVGGSAEANHVPPGAWFAVYANGQYFNDADISGYENVPELAVERKQGSVRLRWFSHTASTWNTSNFEYIAGYVEFFQGNITTQSNDAQAPLETSTVSAGFRDRISVANGHSNFAFVVGGSNGSWLGGTSDPRDGMYTNYVSTATSCVVPEPACTLSAAPTSIDAGDTSTLTWTTSNASSVTLNNSIGSVVLNGSRAITPNSDTTYTLTAVNATGATHTCSATVHVAQPVAPSCSISASPSNVTSGGAVSLTWSSSNANSATVDSLGSVSLTGSRSVYPWQSRDYLMTVYGNNGQTATCSTHVDVGQQAAPTCWINANPSTVQNGGNTVLQWGSSNADSATISDLGSVSTDGSRVVYPYGNRTYTMTVYGHNGQSNTCTAYVNTNVPTPIVGNLSCSISATPGTITAGRYSFLTWNSMGPVSYATLSESGVGTVAGNGSLSIRPDTSRNYTLTVYGTQGQVTSCNTFVTVAGSSAYVALTQIPYTGLDMGPFGDALFWTLIVGMALSVGYLIVHYRGKEITGIFR